MRWNFAHILNKSLIRPSSYENSLWSFVWDQSLWSSDTRPIGLRIYSKYGKIPMLRFRLLIYFLSYTWSLKCGQLQDWKIQVVCIEDSIYPPPIKGHDFPNVVQANDILLQNVRAGKNVVVGSSFIIKESSE